VSHDAKGKKQVRSHHNAIDDIRGFHAANKDLGIYVAECDIKKFFDCLNHEVLKESLAKLSKKHKVIVNAQATQIFNQYLDSYSFNIDVFPLNKSSYFTNSVLNDKK
jgi:hypothetical protein